jgi:Xaa-Pro aminopeptidase
MNPSPEKNRISVFQDRLQQSNIDACLLILSRDVFYYTGTAQPCILIVTPGRYCLMVRRAFDFVRKETFIETEKLMDGGDFNAALQWLSDHGISSGKIGLELDIIPAGLYLKICRIFTGFEFADVSKLIFKQRMIKDENEIGWIKQACRIMDLGHQRVIQTLEPAMTELDLAAEIEYTHRKNGHDGVLSMRHFDFYISRGPLSSGENLLQVSGFADTVTGIGLGPAVPAGPSSRIIQKGDIVITDIPTCYQGYHCDQTRTYYLGRPPHRLSDFFGKLKEISDTVIFAIRSGVTCNDVFTTARDTAQKLGVGDCFLGLPPRKATFLGHGIGLDANEPPILAKGSNFNLSQDMVLTIEIHLTHPDLGVVKLEDMVHVTDSSCEMLSVTPRQLFVL